MDHDRSQDTTVFVAGTPIQTGTRWLPKIGLPSYMTHRTMEGQQTGTPNLWKLSAGCRRGGCSKALAETPQKKKTSEALITSPRVGVALEASRTEYSQMRSQPSAIAPTTVTTKSVLQQQCSNEKLGLGFRGFGCCNWDTGKENGNYYDGFYRDSIVCGASRASGESESSESVSTKSAHLLLSTCCMVRRPQAAGQEGSI